MDSTDREILNRIQREVPLEREPFEAIGRELGIAGDEVIRRIEALKRGRVIRQISAIFDTRVLGYESRLGLEGTVEVLHHISSAEKTRFLPTLKLFKIGVTLDMNAGATAKKEAPQYGESDRESADRNISEDDKAAIRALQEDVPLTPRPFDLWGRQVGLSYGELLERAYDLRDRKIMRRFSAVLYHRKAGFRANAMGVWKVPEECVEEIGNTFAQY